MAVPTINTAAGQSATVRYRKYHICYQLSRLLFKYNEETQCCLLMVAGLSFLPA